MTEDGMASLLTTNPPSDEEFDAKWHDLVQQGSSYFAAFTKTFPQGESPERGKIDVIAYKIYYPTSFFSAGYNIKESVYLKENASKTHMYIPVTSANMVEMWQHQKWLTRRAIAAYHMWDARRAVAKWCAKNLNEKPDYSEAGEWYKWPPRHHQVDAFCRMKKAIYGLLAADCGLGKTYIAVWYMIYLNKLDPSYKFLIVSNKVSLDMVWMEHVREMAPWLKPINVSTYYKKRKNKKRDNLADFNVFIINYDILSKMSKELMELGMDIIFFDEATYVKNPTSTRSKALYLISRKAVRIWGMTGTPMSNGIHNLWSLFNIMDDGVLLGSSYVHFKHVTSFVKTLDGGNKIYMPTTVGVERTLKAVKPYILRYKADECLDLPARTRIRIPFELTAKQRAVYDGIVDDYVAELEDGTEILVSNVLASVTKLRQVSRNFIQEKVIEDDKETSITHIVDEKEDPAMEALEELLESIGDENKTIIWAWYQVEVRKIVELLESKKIKYRVVSGAFPNVNKDKAVTEFDNDPSISVLVANQETLAYAITFKNVQYAIYFSQPYNFDLRYQSERRPWGRIGLNKPVFYYDLFAIDTLDIAISRKLARLTELQEQGIDSQARLTKDKIKSKEELMKLLKGR